MPTTALARKFRVDITTDLTLASGWTQLKGIYALKPNVEPNSVDTSSYDVAGWSSFEITMQGWSLECSFFRRTAAGVYDTAQEILRACVGKFGDSARVGVRWYDTAGGTEAFSGIAIVTWERANDGVKDVDAASITLQGDGTLNTIANPYAAAAVPVVTSALPSGAATGALVTLTGTNFTGTSALTVGGVSAPTRTVVSDSTIVFVMPSGSAGSANIIVTNPAGASTAFAYTRG
jgi:hypothetical protein